MMNLLIPFWGWMILGAILALWVRRILVKKFGFISKLSKPFRPRKKKKKPSIRMNNDELGAPREPDESEDEDETGVERIKSAAKKGAGLLARPLEYFLGGPDDEEDDE